MVEVEHDFVEIDEQLQHVMVETDVVDEVDDIDVVADEIEVTCEFVEHEVIDEIDVIDDEADDAVVHVTVVYLNDDVDEIQFGDADEPDEMLQPAITKHNMQVIDDLVYGELDENDEMPYIDGIMLLHIEVNDEIQCIELDEPEVIDAGKNDDVLLVIVILTEYDEREVTLRDDNID